jgi:1-acyl-sn-glycerol-3-phosphate acyltransferase
MSGQLAPHPPLARNGSFHLLWVSTLLAGFGDRMAMFAVLTMLGFGKGSGNDAALQGGVDFFFFTPYLLWSPIAGWLADRLPRKWLLFAADEARGVMVLLLVTGVLPLGDGGQLPDGARWMGWLLIFLIGLGAATFSPVKISIVPNIVGFAALQRANSVVVNLGIIGNLLGAGLEIFIGKRSVGLCIALSAAAYIVSGIVWPFIRAPQHLAEKPPTFAASMRQLADGVRYVRIHRPIRLLTLLSMLAWAGTSVYLPALATVSTEKYHGGTETYALMLACLAVGMMGGGAFMGVTNTRLETAMVIAVGVIGTGAGLLLQMLVPWKAVGLGMVLMTGLSAGVMFVGLNTLVQRLSADYMRGRVFGAREMLSEVGKVAAAFSIWMLPRSNDFMLPVTIVMGCVLIGVGAWGFYRFVLAGPAPGKGLSLMWRVSRWYADAVHKLRVVGRANPPLKGALLLVSNHTAGLDPLLIQASTMRIVRWMMAAEYMKPYLNFLWKRTRPIGVNRFARDAKSLKTAVEHLKSGGALHRFNAGVGLLALTPGVTVTPIYITGTPNTEAALASYLFPSRSVLVYGKPFTVPEDFDREQATAMIREAIEELRRQHEHSKNPG